MEYVAVYVKNTGKVAKRFSNENDAKNFIMKDFENDKKKVESLLGKDGRMQSNVSNDGTQADLGWFDVENGIPPQSSFWFVLPMIQSV